MPQMIPPLTFSAVPSPKKIRRMLPGCHAPTAATPATAGSTGSPLLTTAAAAAAVDPRPDSRRVAANAVHINGAANGPPPLPPPPNHADKLAPKPVAKPDAPAARGGTTTADVSDTCNADTTTPATGFTKSSEPVGAPTRPETSPTGTLADDRGDAVNPEFSTPRGPPAAPAAAATATGPPDPGTLAGDCGRSASPERPASPRPPTSAGATPPARPLTAEPPPAGFDKPAREPAPTAARRDGTLGFVDTLEAAPSDAPDPADPPDPVVSANATGTADTAEPIPNATAKAPTRPTYRENPTCATDCDAPTARRPYSIARTRPRIERR